MRNCRCVLGLLSVWLVGTACPEADCSDDNDCKGERVCQFGSCVDPPPKGTKACGETLIACNCQSTTLVPGQITNNTSCQSGQGQATPCAGSCGGVGVPWTIACYCGNQRGSGSGGSGGSPGTGGTGGSGASTCPTFATGIRPLAPSPYLCGQPGPIVVSEMSYINQFWGSNVAACVFGADQPGVQGNAVSYGRLGYIYFDPQLLAALDTAGMSFAPSGMVLAHEIGHEIQGWSSTAGQLSITRELGADCYAGYFLGWLGCLMQLNIQDYIAAFNSACSLGTNLPWYAPGNHGTCSMRVQAVQQGIQAYGARVPPLTACTF
jgi:hypothetical protein